MLERVLLCVCMVLAHQWVACAACSGLGFSVELGGSDGTGFRVGISTRNPECNVLTQAVGISDSLTQPLVRVASCPSRVRSADSFLGISHSLLSLGRHHTTTPTSTTTSSSSSSSTGQPDIGAPVWTVEVPGYLESMDCIEVSVRESAVGPGTKIAGTRKQFWLNPPNLSTLSDVDSLCSQLDHELCEIVDTSVFEWTTVALVQTDSGSYVYYMDIDVWQLGMEAALPNCTSTQGLGTHWQLIEGNSVCGEPATSELNASRVYALSNSKLFVLGSSLLYSPDRGKSLYHILWPGGGHLSEIKDFSVAGDLKFAALITSNQTSSVWLGFAGESSLVVLLYPSELVEAYWASQGLQWSDPTLANTTLQFDSNNGLHLVSGNFSLKVPLSIVLQHAATTGYSDNSTNMTCVSSELFHEASQRLPLVQGALHRLAHCRTDACSYSATSVEAPQCGALTRSKLHLTEDGVLRRIESSSLPERNCTVLGDGLPGDLFLGRGEAYNFTVNFVLSHPDPSSLHLLTEVSDSEAMAIRLSKLYESASNVLSYEVCLEEKQRFNGQFSSGYTAESVDVQLQVFQARTKCVDTFTEHSFLIPGRLQTRVHVGCPPGLSLKFDAEASSSQHKQYCKPADNVTCYYYANEFHPVLLVVDAVTEVERVYTGPYTMTALAGGTTLSSMRAFNKTWRSSLWTPVRHSKEDIKTYYHNDSGIQWVCGTTSPCGEIIPDNADASEYYLLLEASNLVVAENETYCHLSVQFLIRVHGMGMGAITTVMTLLLLLAVLLVHVGCCFVAWHYRLKLTYCKDRTVEKGVQRYSTIKQRILELNKKQQGVYVETELKEL